MNYMLSYARHLTFMGWSIIAAFLILTIVALYSGFRKRRSTEN